MKQPFKSIVVDLFDHGHQIGVLVSVEGGVTKSVRVKIKDGSVPTAFAKAWEILLDWEAGRHG